MAKMQSEENEIVFSTKQLSEILNLSTRRVQQLAEEGILKKVAHGKYSGIESMQNYIRSLQVKEHDGKVDYYEEQALHERAKREKAELTLKVMKGELHRSDDVRFVMNDMIIAFRSKVLSLPEKLASQIVGKTDTATILDIIGKEVHTCLVELSEYDPNAFYAKSKDYVDVSADAEEE